MALVPGIAVPFLAVIPPTNLFLTIGGAALLAFGSLMLLSWAYARAEAQMLIPLEYTAFIWASIMGWLVFREPLTPTTLAGAALIRSEEHTSELQSLMRISYAVFCLKNK